MWSCWLTPNILLSIYGKSSEENWFPGTGKCPMNNEVRQKGKEYVKMLKWSDLFSKEIQRAVHKGIPFFNDINGYILEEHTLFTTSPRKRKLHRSSSKTISSILYNSCYRLLSPCSTGSHLVFFDCCFPVFYIHSHSLLEHSFFSSVFLFKSHSGSLKK